MQNSARSHSRVRSRSALTRNARSRMFSSVSTSRRQFCVGLSCINGEKAGEMPRPYYLYFHVPSLWNSDQEALAKRPGSRLRLEWIAVKAN